MGKARLRVVSGKAPGRLGERDHRIDRPGSADIIPPEARGDVSWKRAGPWGTASAQVISICRRYDTTRSACGYLWREGCGCSGAQLQDEIYVGIEVECWCTR